MLLSQAIYSDYIAIWLEGGIKAYLLEIGGKELHATTTFPF